LYSHIGSKMAARRNTKPKKETPKEPKEIIIKPAKEIKETKSVPITVELNILKVLINERPLIPLLRVLKKNKELHTRELLITMGSWGYGQSLMKRATNLGLIERKVKKEKSSTVFVSFQRSWRHARFVRLTRHDRKQRRAY